MAIGVESADGVEGVDVSGTFTPTRGGATWLVSGTEPVPDGTLGALTSGSDGVLGVPPPPVGRVKPGTPAPLEVPEPPVAELPPAPVAPWPAVEPRCVGSLPREGAWRTAVPESRVAAAAPP